MDKIKLYKILCVLLLPYREERFLSAENDVIADVRYTFSKLRHRNELSRGQKMKCENAYYRAEKRLENFLLEHKEWYIHTLDEFRLLLNLFFPEEECDKIYRLNSEGSVKEDIERLYLNNIYKIAESLLTFRDGKIAIRTWMNAGKKNDIFNYPNIFDKVEIWNLLGRMMPADIIIVAFFVRSGLSEVFYLNHQTGNILLADKILDKILQKGLAETHMHFNAGGEFCYLWQQQMDFRIWDKKIDDRKDEDREAVTFVQAVYRMLWAEYLENEKNESFKQFIECEYITESGQLLHMIESMHCGQPDCNREQWSKIYPELRWLWTLKYGVPDENEEFLFSTVYQQYRGCHTYSEMIVLFKSLLHFEKYPQRRDELHLFLQYLRGKSIYFSKIVQSNQIQGFKNFGKFYGAMSNEMYDKFEQKKRYDMIFKSVAHNIYLRKLEVRITPEVKIVGTKDHNQYRSVEAEIRRKILNSILAVLEAYKKHTLETIGIPQWEGNADALKRRMKKLEEENRISVPTIGIVFHFIKNDFVDNRIGDMCWLGYDPKRKTESKHLIFWRQAMVKTAQIIEELRSEIPLLSEYVVGIDAASEENKAEPWIFAPVYAKIRNKMITKPALRDENGKIFGVNNMGFTYHVGEEFRHLLSGLRHIDEVVRHFHYKPGDRLGHALALGIDVKNWMDNNEVVVIPILEHMENLLWVWGNLIHHSWNIEMSAEVIEGKILELAKQIYGEINGLSVHMLYDAYQEKFKLMNYEDIFDKMQHYKSDENAEEDANVRNHFCRFYNVNSVYGIMWTVEKVFCTYFCPAFYQRFQEPIFVYVDSEEFGMLKKIQNYMIRQIEQLGIYVETNPTSNLAIGEIKKLYAEPLLLLNSKELLEERQSEHEVLITINSDDPIIFSTSSENELAYIYYALTNQGYKKESVLKWIDKVRQMGLDSSFVKKEKEPYQQLCEISKLIEEIRDITKVRN